MCQVDRVNSRGRPTTHTRRTTRPPPAQPPLRTRMLVLQLAKLRVEYFAKKLLPLLVALTHCQMVRSGQPTWVLIPVFSCSMGRNLRLRTRRSHTSTRTQRTQRVYTSSGLQRVKPYVQFFGLCKGSPRLPYIGQRKRSVPRLLVGYDQET
jgi:hypothetical protein